MNLICLYVEVALTGLVVTGVIPVSVYAPAVTALVLLASKF